MVKSRRHSGVGLAPWGPQILKREARRRGISEGKPLSFLEAPLPLS